MDARSAPPNVLIIMPDQMRGQAMGCMGDPDVKTPHLDRLASQGILFTQMFANTPVCSPARATILTGKYPHKHGMICNDLRLRESEVTLAEILKGHGYRTGFIGKWHLDGGKRLPGFIPPGERRQGFDFWAANECDHSHFKNHYFRDDPEPIVMNDYETRVWTDLAIEFVSANRDAPFFLEIAMGPPHNPYKAPDRFATMYDPQKLTMRANWEGAGALTSREDIAQYYGMISDVDEQVGRLLAKLDELGIADNTIILFTSDHGDMLGSHKAILKRKPWEESIRIPGILRHPAKIAAGQTLDVLFSHVDIAPTLLGLCGFNAPGDMQGENLAPRLLNQTESEPESIFFQIFVENKADDIPAPWRGVRTKTHLYARFEAEPWVLYDLRSDPYELHNREGDPKFEPVRAEMENRLSEFMSRTGDSWSHNIQMPVEDKGRLYSGPAFYSVEEFLRWSDAESKTDDGTAKQKAKPQANPK
jgi:arylsulfatase A-like enzyme